MFLVLILAFTLFEENADAAEITGAASEICVSDEDGNAAAATAEITAAASETCASDEEEHAAFAAAVSFNAPVYTDPETGITYTQTMSGETVTVTGTSYENALAAGDQEECIAILKAQTTSFYWTDSHLTEYEGVNKGPAGTETWYNLNMSEIVSTLQDNGYEGEYWVRGDGVKMYGLYILCAADYSTYSYGTIVETSLGTGIIADTGCCRGVIDIAVNW